jgi:hypothetical protein
MTGPHFINMLMSSSEGSENVALLHKKARGLLRQGKPESYILEELRKEGITMDYAQIIMANVYNDIHDRKSFWKLLFSGLFFIIGGLAINFFSYQIAVNTGSLFFYLFWGIVVSGIVMIAKAFIIFKK